MLPLNSITKIQNLDAGTGLFIMWVFILLLFIVLHLLFIFVLYCCTRNCPSGIFMIPFQNNVVVVSAHILPLFWNTTQGSRWKSASLSQSRTWRMSQVAFAGNWMSKHIRGTNEWNVLMPAPTIPQWPPEFWRQKKKKKRSNSLLPVWHCG